MAERESGLNIDALRRAIDALHIRDVTLRESKLHVDDKFDVKFIDESALSVRLGWGARRSRMQRVKHRQTHEEHGVFFKVDIGTNVHVFDSTNLSENATDDEINERTVARLDATFMVEYQVNSDDPLPDDAQAEFARKNAPYHVWPFWREFAYATLGRVGIAGVMLPMMVMGTPQPDKVVQTQVERKT